MRTKALWMLAVVILFTGIITRGASDEIVVRVDSTIPAGSSVQRVDQATISMSTSFANGSIFYTLDGSQPSGANTRYAAPFTITSTKTIRAIAYSVDFSQSVESAPVEVQIVPGVTLSLTLLSPDGGAVTLNPPPTNGKYMSNSVVQLSAVANTGWTFVRWEGAVTGTAQSVSLKMDGDKGVNAVFQENTVSLSMALVAPAAGMVALDPQPVAGRYTRGAVVQLAALPSSGWKFIRWEGAVTGTVDTASLTMDVDKAVTAVFGTAVAILPSSHGSIHASGDASIVIAGGSITLAAVPDSGYYFAAWGGDATGSESPFLFDVNEPTPQISALFLPLPDTNKVTLTVYPENEGGQIRIKYPNVPDATLPYYTRPDGRILEAIPKPGWTFTGWTGDLTTSDNPAAIRLDTSKVVVAHFAPGFSVVVETQDGGFVSRTPDQGSYATNAAVQLEAQPQAGFTFAGWSTAGGVTMTNPLTITVTNNVFLSARFDAPRQLPVWTFAAKTMPLAIAADQEGNGFVLSTFSCAKIKPSGNVAWNISFTDVPAYAPSFDMAIDAGGNARVSYIGGGNEFQLPATGIRTILPNGAVDSSGRFGGGQRISIGPDQTIYTLIIGTRSSGRSFIIRTAKWLHRLPTVKVNGFSKSHGGTLQISSFTTINILARQLASMDGPIFPAGAIR